MKRVIADPGTLVAVLLDQVKEKIKNDGRTFSDLWDGSSIRVGPDFVEEMWDYLGAPVVHDKVDEFVFMDEWTEDADGDAGVSEEDESVESSSAAIKGERYQQLLQRVTDIYSGAVGGVWNDFDYFMGAEELAIVVPAVLNVLYPEMTKEKWNWAYTSNFVTPELCADWLWVMQYADFNGKYPRITPT